MKRILITLAIVSFLPQLFAGNFVMDKEQSVLAAEGKAYPPHKFTYVATKFECDIQISPNTLLVEDATCTFNFKDLDSGKPGREKKMLKWMDEPTFPSASFKLTKVTAGEQEGEFIGVGELEFHGVSKEVSIPFTVRRDGDEIILDGETEIDYTDWDLPIVRLAVFSVKSKLRPHFHLVGKLSE